MRNEAQWMPTKFELRRSRWRGSRDPAELGIGSPPYAAYAAQVDHQRALSRRHFPFGYFMIAQRPSAPPP